ncbi:MAG: diphthamide biosynthesis enzyme Dph2 [Candidatus Thermoplasmatota archaeon]|jgi:2-(3-amino-3-carboxypropyl)histidine synthase|nr:diphthamide biosynthesis enzyme Dph2 [Candidatus Thermoplasmatota archaeon]
MDFRAVLRKIKEDERYKKAKSVAVQLPEGMKRGIADITSEFVGKELIFVGDPFWGACDIPQSGNWDLLIQFGHSPIPNLGSFSNVIFEEIQESLDFDIEPEKIPFKALVLTSNVTYSNQLPIIKNKLEEHGIRVVLKKGDNRVFYPGQILGCNISTARGIEDSVLFVGEGMFHPLGIALGLPEKKVLSFNPKTGEYTDMEETKRKFLGQRYGAIDLASRAKKFGIIVSTKIGQTRYSLARVAFKLLQEAGKSPFIITLDLVREEELMNFPAEVYVNTSCPRVTVEDYGSFSRPVISFYELQMALGLKDKSRYIFDEIVMTDEIGSSSFRKWD